MSIDLNPLTFCPFPFYQTVVRNTGLISPCCNIHGVANTKNIDMKQEWQSESRQAIKTQMLNGATNIEACTVCYNDERNFGHSMRTRALKDYKFLSEKHYDKMFNHMKFDSLKFPKRVEIHVGNLCNLKCLTCGPQYSSSVLREDTSLGLTNFRLEDFQIDNAWLSRNLDMCIQSSVDMLDLRGGESMLHPLIKKFLLDVPADRCPETLRIQTNCTKLDDKWKTILEKFKKVEIMASIDAFGADNHYIRYPSDWSIVESSIDYFRTLKHAKLYVNCTLSNLNFLVLDKLIAWCEEKQIYLHFTLLENPAYFKFNNLPTILFDKVKQKLSQYDSHLTDIIKKNPANDQSWQTFCNIISMRDQHRKNSIFDMLPELKSYWSVMDA